MLSKDGFQRSPADSSSQPSFCRCATGKLSMVNGVLRSSLEHLLNGGYALGEIPQG